MNLKINFIARVSRSITLSFVEDAIQRIESQKDTKPVDKQGVLEKLLKVDKTIATVMSMDMLAVGVDTVSFYLF